MPAGAFTVGTSPLPLNPGDTDAAALSWENLYIRNDSGSTIYARWTIDDQVANPLTTTNGFPIPTGSTQWVKAPKSHDRRGPIMVVAASGPLTIHFAFE